MEVEFVIMFVILGLCCCAMGAFDLLGMYIEKERRQRQSGREDAFAV